jgi:hypothetical protein
MRCLFLTTLIQIDLQTLNNGNYLMEIKASNASSVRQLFTIVK